MTNPVVRRCALAAALAVFVVAVGAGGARGTTVGLTARLSNVSKSSSTASYPVFDGNNNPNGTAQWRIVNGVGNCCENYFNMTPSGRIMSLAGAYIEYTDDKGLSWKSVSPSTEFLLGAEGGAVAAPGGDIVGLTWDPYTGDRVISYKYVAAENQWYYIEGSLHQPFADRPWISVIPGPFTIGAVTVPYISALSAGTTRQILFVSLDGLNYDVPDPTLGDALANTPVSSYLSSTPSPAQDAMQSIRTAAVTPLAGGGALVDGIALKGCRYRIIKPPSVRAACFTWPDGSDPTGEFQVDSQGRLHNMILDTPEDIIYRVSSNGGQTWSTTNIHIPDPYEVRYYDWHPNGVANVTAFGIHATNWQTHLDQDMVVKVSIAGAPQVAPTVIKTLLVGKGDRTFGAGITTNGPRFDFASLVVLPDGKVATSFGDSSHLSPDMAVEL